MGDGPRARMQKIADKLRNVREFAEWRAANLAAWARNAGVDAAEIQ